MNENQRCSPAERGWARGSRGGCARRRVCVCVSLFVCECVSVCKVWGEGFGGRGGQGVSAPPPLKILYK